MSVELVLSLAVALMLVILWVTPIILLIYLVSKISKPKPNPQSVKKIEELEMVDAAIIEDTNNALETLLEKITTIEERLDKEDSTIKGFKK